MIDDEFHTWESSLDLSENTRLRILTYDKKYPVLHDYFKSLQEQLLELDKDYRMSGPKEREKTSGNLSSFCYSVMTSLDNMDEEGFSFLYDENLWPMLRMAIQNGLPINHMWIKSLISANILELAINNAIKKINREKYNELNKKGSGLDNRFKELNSLLESKSLKQFMLNTIDFESLKAIRNLVDHPDPNALNEIQEKHVKDTIAYAIYAMKQLTGAFETLNKQ